MRRFCMQNKEKKQTNLNTNTKLCQISALLRTYLKVVKKLDADAYKKEKKKNRLGYQHLVDYKAVLKRGQDLS